MKPEPMAVTFRVNNKFTRDFCPKGSILRAHSARLEMAYHFELDTLHRVLLFRFYGEVSEQRIGKFYSEAGAMIERVHPRAALFDFTEVTAFDVSSDAVRSLAEAPPLIQDAACPRVVVAPAKHIFAMSRMFQILGGSSRPTFAVAHSMTEALAAIGLEHPDFKPLTTE